MTGAGKKDMMKKDMMKKDEDRKKDGCRRSETPGFPKTPSKEDAPKRRIGSFFPVQVNDLIGNVFRFQTAEEI